MPQFAYVTRLVDVGTRALCERQSRGVGGTVCRQESYDRSGLAMRHISCRAVLDSKALMTYA
jgi:hypothetical protein